MAHGFKDFYCTLLENLENFDGEYASFIDCGPNLFKLLCDLLDEDVDKEDRIKINAAISYYVVPMDVIPEEIYGAYGYIDDIFISVYVLKFLAEKYSFDFLQEAWDFGNDVEEVIEDCYEKSLESLTDEQIEAILFYVGLD